MDFEYPMLPPGLRASRAFAFFATLRAMSLPDPFTHRPANRSEAECLIAAIRERLAERAIAHRDPPPVPTTCCGRGCNGCVWAGYFEALLYWRDDARRLLG